MKILAALLSLLLAVVFFIIYWVRPDALAALTIFPAWTWLIFWLLTLPIWKHKLTLLVTLAWLAFAFIHVEEWRSLLRTWQDPSEPRQSLRVVTLNCAGSIKPLEAAMKMRPDVLLIQESPNRNDIAERLGGYTEYRYLEGPDTGILVRGTIEPVAGEIFYTAGKARIDEADYFIVSLRLRTSDPRVDLWTKECWVAQTAMRVRQMGEFSRVVEQLPETQSIILGGDFNVAQGDRIFSLIDDFLIDSFTSGGRGICNTILVQFPILRIDQIWTSADLKAWSAQAERVSGSDHRLYVADISINDLNPQSSEKSD